MIASKKYLDRQYNLIIQVFCCLSFWQFGYSQTTNEIPNPWSIQKVEKSRDLSIDLTLPKHFQHTYLDVDALTSILEEAPLRFTKAAKEKEILLAVPYPNGTFGTFQIVEAPVLHPDLGKRFPLIRSYEGIGKDDPTAKIRFDWSPSGFHAMILSAQQDIIFIESYDKKDIKHYYVFYKKDAIQEASPPFKCGAEVSKLQENSSSVQSRGKENCQLKVYRMAIACTGEYGQYHGGTMESVLAAMNTTLTRVNMIFENDVNVSFQIIPDNTNLIFLDSISDPYDATSMEAMLDQNQVVVDSIIGTDNYDIGHLFNIGKSDPPAAAVPNSVCRFFDKAEGVTGQSPPEGHRFDVEYASHEIGHQLGASHSFIGTLGRCEGASNASRVELGSGSTIMSYAGICEVDDVQSFSDPYFHALSIDQMKEVKTLFGFSSEDCVELIDLGREAPIVDAGQTYTIPSSTPFILEGTAIASNQESVTYCWEQMDTRGQLFRSYPPTPSGKRFFPNLENLANNNTPWETLPTESRTMKFRLTVRENQIGGGCSSFDDVEISVMGEAGPFLVEYPNDNILWLTGGNETVEWEVSNTNVSPINTENVNIYLSTDGGLTYPILLLENAPNIGEAVIAVPDIDTKEARVMVKATNNIFYDISDNNFEIQSDSLSTPIFEHLVNPINWSVSPNPFKDQLFFNLEKLPRNKEMKVVIIDILGKTIFEQTINNLNNLQITTNQWVAGSYTIGIIDSKTGGLIGNFKRVIHISD